MRHAKKHGAFVSKRFLYNNSNPLEGREHLIESDSMTPENKVADTILQGVDLEEKVGLADATVTDIELARPRKLSEITKDEEPLMPLPPDTLGDVFYPTRFESRCVLCKSPWRERAEHIFLENAQKPAAVVTFFAHYFNAKVSWECVDTHMENHCTLSAYSKGGIKGLIMRQDEIAEWKYRERDIVIMALMVELDEIKRLDTKKNPDIQLKKSQRVESICKSIRDATRERDEAGGEMINVFDIIKDLLERLTHAESKQIIREYIRDLRVKLAEG